MGRWWVVLAYEEGVDAAVTMNVLEASAEDHLTPRHLADCELLALQLVVRDGIACESNRTPRDMVRVPRCWSGWAALEPVAMLAATVVLPRLVG